MKKSSILVLVALCLYSCMHSSKQVRITGEIKGLGTDTLYLYGMDELLDRVDTIYVENDQFSYTGVIDTITPAYLLMNDEVEYPIYLDKGDKIKIEGDISHPEFLKINGNQYNEEFSAFQESIRELNKDTDEHALAQKAEEFIRNHHSSFVSIYLLDKYMVRQENPDWNKIKELTALMSGVLQDKSYIRKLNEFITQEEKTEIGKFAPFFSLPNSKGEKMSRTSKPFSNKNLLINFWASWEGDSIVNHRSNKELKSLYKKYKDSKYMAMIGISFDMDKEQWTSAIKRDSLNWEQLCDFGGLQSDLALQYAVRQLPGTILISPDGKVLAKNLQGEALKKKIEEAITAAQEKEKREKNLKNK